MNYLAPGAVILVTGGTGGIGFEICAQAAAAGATVAVHGSRPETVTNAMERMQSRIPEAKLIAAPGDFRVAGVVENVVEKVAGEAGRLDAVIHCAITGPPGTTGFFRKTEPQNYGAMAALVLGVFQQLSFAALPHLAKQGGTIVAFASDAGRFAAPRQALLSAAFGGIMTFVRNLAVEVARDNVRVHCISPSYVLDTPVFERFGVGGRGETAAQRAGLGLPSPKDIAPLALFLCGPDATKMTGQIISINGGLNA
jgi:3-oxoacyl-[acyl-carrier protein] reductase